MVADRVGPTASITVEARGIAILGRTGRRQGGIHGSDGAGVIDLHASKMQELQVLHTWSWDTVATRTVTVTASVKDGNSKRTALDAWVIES